VDWRVEVPRISGKAYDVAVEEAGNSVGEVVGEEDEDGAFEGGRGGGGLLERFIEEGLCCIAGSPVREGVLGWEES